MIRTVPISLTLLPCLCVFAIAESAMRDLIPDHEVANILKRADQDASRAQDDGDEVVRVLSEYRARIKTAPSRREAAKRRLALGTLLDHLGRKVAAASEFRDALRDFKLFPAAWTALGDWELEQGAPNAAALSYFRALQIDSSSLRTVARLEAIHPSSLDVENVARAALLFGLAFESRQGADSTVCKGWARSALWLVKSTKEGEVSSEFIETALGAAHVLEKRKTLSPRELAFLAFAYDELGHDRDRNRVLDRVLETERTVSAQRAFLSALAKECLAFRSVKGLSDMTITLLLSADWVLDLESSRTCLESGSQFGASAGVWISVWDQFGEASRDTNRPARDRAKCAALAQRMFELTDLPDSEWLKQFYRRNREKLRLNLIRNMADGDDELVLISLRFCERYSQDRSLLGLLSLAAHGRGGFGTRADSRSTALRALSANVGSAAFPVFVSLSRTKDRRISRVAHECMNSVVAGAKQSSAGIQVRQSRRNASADWMVWIGTGEGATFAQDAIRALSSTIATLPGALGSRRRDHVYVADFKRVLLQNEHVSTETWQLAFNTLCRLLGAPELQVSVPPGTKAQESELLGKLESATAAK